MKQIIVDNLVTNYSISKDGKCYNNNTGKYLKGQISNSGYLNFNLTLPGGIKKRFYAHRLVAQAYLENKENKPEVNHKNGNKLDNTVENLEWVTSKENSQHSISHGLKKNLQKVYQYSKDLELIHIFDYIEQVKEYGYDVYSVSCEIHRPKKSLTLGYFWNDKEDNGFEIEKVVNTGKAKRVGQYDLDGNLLHEFISTGAAAKFVNGTHSHIGECCRGKLKTYKGFKWKYI
jgi:hypothetical protein